VNGERGHASLQLSKARNTVARCKRNTDRKLDGSFGRVFIEAARWITNLHGRANTPTTFPRMSATLDVGVWKSGCRGHPLRAFARALRM
jgi:hypothetical protein